jgi:autotransporter-associated beta strand protein
MPVKARGSGQGRLLYILAIVAALFGVPARAQQSSNDLLLPYLSLLNSPDVTAANLRQAIAINNNSTASQRGLATADAGFAFDNGSVVADGLGTGLNQIYRNAIDSNSPLIAESSNIVQAFRQANGLATADAAFSKLFFFNGARVVTGTVSSDLRPFQAAGNQIQSFAPDLLAPLIDNPAFPSGHSTFAYTQDLLFGIIVPERYQQLLTRASEYGNSRIVLGAHYPLDTIGGRIIATYDVVQLLNNNPAALNKTVSLFGGGTVTTSSDFAALFDQATADLRGLLQQGCGSDLATCASASPPDRFSNTRGNRDEYNFRLTYGLPSAGPSDLPPVVPAGAEVLLKTRFPYLSAAQLRDVLATTELPSGVPLDDGSGWARLNLYEAADGYGAFNDNVAVTMDSGRGGFSSVDSWNNDIGGIGGLTLSGTGTLVLTGADTYSGPTIVDGGTLIVNGSIASPVFVNPGGTLRGTGAINAALVNNGILAPGSPIDNPTGTLVVNGNVTQGPGAAFQTRLDQTGASRLHVHGTAVLDGMLEVKPSNGFIPLFGQTFPILGASQGISGTFASVAAPSLPGSLFYQPLYTAYSIDLMAARPLAEFGETLNQQRIATALDRLRTNPDRAVQNVLSVLYPAEAAGGVARALDQLAPENTFSTTLSGRLFADMLDNQLAERASALRAGSTGFSAASSRFDVAGFRTDTLLGTLLQATPADRLAATDRGDQGTALIASDRPLAGFISGQIAFGDHNLTRTQNGRGVTAGGMTLGLDYRVAPMSAIGISGSYFSGGMDIAGGSANARAGMLALYGTTQSGPIYLDGFVGGGIIDDRTARRFDFGGMSMTESGAVDGRMIVFGADTGYRFARQTEGGMVRWGPVGRLGFNNVTMDGYSESGFGPLSSHIDRRDAASFQTGLGAEAAFEIATATGFVTPHLRATWQHEFADTAETAIADFPIAPKQPFALTSSRLGRNFASVAAGVSGRLGAGTALSADYVGEVGRSGEIVHQLSLIARLAF